MLHSRGYLASGRSRAARLPTLLTASQPRCGSSIPAAGGTAAVAAAKVPSRAGAALAVVYDLWGHSSAAAAAVATCSGRER